MPFCPSSIFDPVIFGGFDKRTTPFVRHNIESSGQTLCSEALDCGATLVHAATAEEFFSGANGYRLQHRASDLSCSSGRHLSYRDAMRGTRNHEVALLISPN